MQHYNAYKHVIPIQVRFADVDRLNHVNNACYLTYFELGRVRYFNQVLGPVINWNEQGFVLARTEIDHLAPIFLNDEVYCATRVVKLGNKSLTVENTVFKLQNGTVVECAKGLGVLVATKYTSGTSMELPAEWRQLLEGFEKQL